MVDVKYHYDAIKQRVNPKLKRLWIETTDLCNSHCKTCSIWTTQKSNRRLNYSVLADPIFKDVTYILNSGGEPSLCDLEFILLMEHHLLPKATLQISTNGLLPDKVIQAVKKALDAGAKIDVGISLDGIGDDHDKFRGVPGNFAKVDYLIHELVRLNNKKLCVTIGSTLTNETAKQADALITYAKDHDVHFMWHWPNKSTFYKNTESFDANQTTNKTLLVEAINKAYPVDTEYKQQWLRNLDGENPCFNCYALKSFAVLKCNGDLVPCLSHWDCSIGNILDNKPTQVWSSKTATDMRIKVHECGLNGCLNSWGYGWSITDAYFPGLKEALNRRLKK